MNNAATSHILPAQSPLHRHAPLFAKGIQATVLAGFITLTLLSAANGATFSGNLKGVTITDAQANNKAPIAAFTYTNNGATFTFNASGSSDPDGTITEYQWDFGNGSKGTGATVNTTYAPGNYPVTLTVIDNAKGVALAQQNVTYSNALIIEDAEDGTTSGWTIYDNVPVGATFTNEFDTTRQSKVIRLAGNKLDNGFSLAKMDGTSLLINSKYIINLSLKTLESFMLYVQTTTSSGMRYLTYSNAATSSLGTSTYVNYGLGTNLTNGTWQNISRNLQTDLATAQPGVTLISVDKILLRGNLSVDDISFQ